MAGGTSRRYSMSEMAFFTVAGQHGDAGPSKTDEEEHGHLDEPPEAGGGREPDGARLAPLIGVCHVECPHRGVALVQPEDQYVTVFVTLQVSGKG